MQISLLLMQQIAQLFLVLLMGYAVVKTGLLKASDSKVLSVVFVYLVMPCVVLNAFQIKDTPEIRTGPPSRPSDHQSGGGGRIPYRKDHLPCSVALPESLQDTRQSAAV